MRGKLQLVIGVFLAFVLCLAVMPANAFAENKTVHAEDGVSSFQLVSNNLSSFSLDASKISNSTPVDDAESYLLGGQSFVPAVLTNQYCKYISDTLDFASVSSGLNLTGVVGNNLYLKMWVYFGSHNLRETTFSLQNADNTCSLTWTLSASTLATMLEREYSTLDSTIYGSNIPYGWNLICLPFVTATIENGGDILTVVDADNTTLNLTKLVISQSASEILPNCPLKIYTVTLFEDSRVSLNVAQKKQNAVHISYKETYAMADLLDGTYYTNEYITLPTINDLFAFCVIGEEDYLSSANIANRANLFKINIEQGNLGTVITKNFGEAYKVISTDLVIRACVLIPGTETLASVSRAIINATSYGTGVWFSSNNVNMEVGQVYNLTYVVHNAFSGATIEFESSDESILKIVSVDKANCVVQVEAKKKGTASIKITVNDDRLIDTDYNETGLVNTDLEIKITKEINNATLTKIFFWVCFGLIVAALGFFAVKAILDSRKVQYK